MAKAVPFFWASLLPFAEGEKCFSAVAGALNAVFLLHKNCAGLQSFNRDKKVYLFQQRWPLQNAIFISCI
jgi:hypothetical protein